MNNPDYQHDPMSVKRYKEACMFYTEVLLVMQVAFISGCMIGYWTICLVRQLK